MFYFLFQIAPWDKYVLHEDLKICDFINLGLNFGAPLWRVSSRFSLKKDYAFNHDVPWKQIFLCHWMWSSIKKWDFSLAFKSNVAMDEMTSVSIAGKSIVV